MPITVDELPSRSYRGLEFLVLGGLILAAIALIGGTVAITSGSTGLLVGGGIVLGMIIAGPVVSIVAAVLLYLDAKKLAAYDGDLDWTPSPGLYGVLGFLFSGLAVLDYLYKRQNTVIDWEGRSNWWLVAIAGLVLALFVSILGGALGQSGLSLAGAVFLVLLPVGLYKDASYVRLNAPEWQPNPIAQLTYSTIALFITPITVLYLSYYLYKRRSHLGLL